MFRGFKTPDGKCESLDDALAHPEIYGLPRGLLAALAVFQRKERKADVSVTELIAPPQVSILKRRHDYYESPEEMLWATWGKVTHVIAQEGAGNRELVEQTMFLNVAGVLIEGTFDIYDSVTRTIYDYKTVNVLKWKYRDFDEMVLQQNIYRFMAIRSLRLDVEKMKLIFIFRDYRPGEKQRESWYPESPIIEYEVPIMSDEQVLTYLTNRVELWKSNVQLPDAELTKCTDEETWKGKRCQSYCPVAKYCHQFSRAKAEVADAAAK